MGTAARDTRSSNRQLSSKLRDALGQVQQNEISNRLRQSADWLRTGRGGPATMRDAVTTQALNNLRDQLHEIQKSLGNGTPGAGDKDRQALEQALAQTERLRKELERGLSRRQGQQDAQQGQQPGQKSGQEGQRAGQQSGQQGQQPGQEPGGQPTGSVQPGEGQPGQIGPRTNGRQNGLDPGPGPAWGDAGEFVQNYRRTLRDLESNPQIGKDLRNTIQDMYRFDPRQASSNPELMGRIENQMLGGVEQIELQLRRMLDDQGGAVRSGSAEPVPQGYADAVAEYFRRLSKSK